MIGKYIESRVMAAMSKFERKKRSQELEGVADRKRQQETEERQRELEEARWMAAEEANTLRGRRKTALFMDDRLFKPLGDDILDENGDLLSYVRKFDPDAKDGSWRIPPLPGRKIEAGVPENYIPHPRTEEMIGRTLTDLETRAKNRKIVLVHGMPGSGRTSTLSEFAREAKNRNMPVVTADLGIDWKAVTSEDYEFYGESKDNKAKIRSRRMARMIEGNDPHRNRNHDLLFLSEPLEQLSPETPKVVLIDGMDYDGTDIPGASRAEIDFSFIATAYLNHSLIVAATSLPRSFNNDLASKVGLRAESFCLPTIDRDALGEDVFAKTGGVPAVLTGEASKDEWAGGMLEYYRSRGFKDEELAALMTVPVLIPWCLQELTGSTFPEAGQLYHRFIQQHGALGAQESGGHTERDFGISYLILGALLDQAPQATSEMIEKATDLSITLPAKAPKWKSEIAAGKANLKEQLRLLNF